MSVFLFFPNRNNHHYSTLTHTLNISVLNPLVLNVTFSADLKKNSEQPHNGHTSPLFSSSKNCFIKLHTVFSNFISLVNSDNFFEIFLLNFLPVKARDMLNSKLFNFRLLEPLQRQTKFPFFQSIQKNKKIEQK